MAASNYLLALAQRREILISQVVDHLVGVLPGSAQHEVAVAYAARSLTHHDQLDPEPKKVETLICGMAEKLLMDGQPQDAMRLLLLSSRLSGKPMRVEGYRMPMATRADAAGFGTDQQLVHPYAALALVLALSGSASPIDDGDRGEIRTERRDGNGSLHDELDDLIGDSSKLWSTDSEDDDTEQVALERGRENDKFVDTAVKQTSQTRCASAPQQEVSDSDEEEGAGDGGGTQEWLQAFQDERYQESTSDHGSACTDDEGYDSGGDETRRFSSGQNGRTSTLPATQDTRSKAVTDSLPQAIGPAYCDGFRHIFGVTCLGTDIRSVGAAGSPLPFLRPCQTLEACQSVRPHGGVRRRSIPEAEVARAAMDMLQGLAGDIFVRLNKDSGNNSTNRGGDPCRNDRSFCPFALSAYAASDLAISTLSPEALAGVLGDFVQLGCTAEYLRAFVADADASALIAAGTRGALPLRSSSHESRNNSWRECKHGHATQAFVTCVRRQLGTFEDAVASRDRWLYRRQRGQDENLDRNGSCPHHQQHPTTNSTVHSAGTRWDDGDPSLQRKGGGAGSGETLIGIFELLRGEAESIFLTRRLVEAGAGWWAETPAGKGTRPGEGSGGLRERTGRLLESLYDALLTDALVSPPLLGAGVWLSRSRPHVTVAAAAEVRRRGWLLSVFCNVLAPYLRLMDAWVTEGRIVDPHGELFFSQTGGTGGIGGVDDSATAVRPKNSGDIGRTDEDGSGNRDGVHCRHTRQSQEVEIEPDPVVPVWDTGVVLHENALPSFLRPLASAVALAGQDISLMRRVRGLVATTPEASLAAATGRYLLRTRAVKRCQSGVETVLGGDDKSFSLADTLFDSLEKMTRRVRSARATTSTAGDDDDGPLAATGLQEESDDFVVGGSDGHERSAGDKAVDNTDGNADDTAATRTAEGESGAQVGAGRALRKARVRWMAAGEEDHSEEEKGGKEDGDYLDWERDRSDDTNGNRAASQDQEVNGLVTSLVVPGSPASSPKQAMDEKTNDEDDAFGLAESSVKMPANSTGNHVERRLHALAADGNDGVGDEGGERAASSPKTKEDSPPSSSPTLLMPQDAEGKPVGADHPDGPRRFAAIDHHTGSGSTSSSAAGNAVCRGGGDGGGESRGEGTHGEAESGFFAGTAQLALAPGATLRRALHPALAPPSLPGLDRDPQPRLPECLLMQGQAAAPSHAAYTAGSRPGARDDTRKKEKDGIDSGVVVDAGAAPATETVADVLPPSVVLETCLLAPLRDRCRLASSSCLGVFVDELGLTRIAGVLRAVYLSPGGSARGNPLSLFRAVLFGALARTGDESRRRKTVADAALSGGVIVRDVHAFLQDAPRITSLLHASLAMTEIDLAGGNMRGGTESASGSVGGRGEAGDAAANDECLRVPVVGADRPLLEHFFVECRPERVQERRGGPQSQPKPERGFPLTSDGRCIDLRVFSCLQLQCRLPWPQSVALPPRSMEKYSRTLSLLLKLEFAVHVLEESHVLHSRAQRDQPATRGPLDRRHVMHMRLFAFLGVARATRCYVVTQALVKPWAEFLGRVPHCASLRGFIRLHEAYLDLILDRCFLLPRSRQTLAYLLDALQAGIVFSQRYGEYLVQLNRVASGSEKLGTAHLSAGGASDTSASEAYRRERIDAVRASLARLDELWDTLIVSLGFVLPLLKEMVRSRSGVHVNELLIDLDFNLFFEQQQGWRGTRRDASRSKQYISTLA